jgi:hypothetical protein
VVDKEEDLERKVKGKSIKSFGVQKGGRNSIEFESEAFDRS